MLRRAALPLLRPRLVSYAIRVPITAQPSRWYAKDRKPQRPPDYKLPPNATQSRVQAWSGTNQEATRVAREEQESAKDYSESQEEFSSPVAPERNIAPEPEAPAYESNEAPTDSTTSPADYSKVQEDIDATAATDAKKTLGPEDTEPGPTSQHASSQPLPDLTRGIPSTLHAEMQQAKSRRQASPTSLNLTEEPSEAPAGGRGGGGDLPKSAYISSLERRRNRFINIIYAAFFGFATMSVVYLGRNWETEEEERKHPNAPSGWGFGLFYDRLKARLGDTLDYYNEPAFPKLLPDEDPQYKAPFTLVLSLEDLLVHSEWTREHGWRMAKRPGVDYFLRYLSQYYELVLFTSVPSMMADPVLRKLDPYRIIRWPLFREATRYKNGEYIKDLSYLNRDLSKVILIDTVPAHAKEQPDNAIILPKWTGDPKDQTLVALIPFLEYVANMGFDDTRTVLKSFEGTFIPVEFARRERKIREEFERQIEEERKKRPKRSIRGLGSLLGLKPSGPMVEGMDQSSAEALEQGKMLWDQIRERGQKNYEQIEKEIRENGEKWLAEMAAEEKKMQEEQMKGMRSSFTTFFSSGDGDKK